MFKPTVASLLVGDERGSVTSVVGDKPRRYIWSESVLAARREKETGPEGARQQVLSQKKQLFRGIIRTPPLAGATASGGMGKRNGSMTHPAWAVSRGRGASPTYECAAWPRSYCRWRTPSFLSAPFRGERGGARVHNSGICSGGGGVTDRFPATGTAPSAGRRVGARGRFKV